MSLRVFPCYKMQLQTYKTSLNLLVWFFSLLFFETHVCEGTDVISIGQTLSGNQTISSENEMFELGFFTPGKSRNYYIGIWYKIFDTNKTVVWVANRNHPVSNHFSSKLKLFPNGNLALLDESGIQIWSSNATATTDNSSYAILLDNGNFVTRYIQDSSLVVIWQSFDYPTDTWLPAGVAGYNKIKKEKIYLTSWKNLENPAPGPFTYEVEFNSIINHTLVDCRARKYKCVVDCAGQRIVPVTDIVDNYMSIPKHIYSVKECKFLSDIVIPKTQSRSVIDVRGGLGHFLWRENFPEHVCNLYSDMLSAYKNGVSKTCDAFLTCTEFNSYSCFCDNGYKLSLGEDYTYGCIVKSREKREGSGGLQSTTLDKPGIRIWIVVGAIGGFFILLGIVTFFILQLRKRKVGISNGAGGNLMFFKYKEIRKSTKCFSEKLGEGGFGSVYKGTLPNSRAIAVKRLKNLKQGEKQFRAEVSTIGQIQHLNLVHLQGFCIEGDKRLLVFDYMKNGSLENYLFRGKFNFLLDWKARYKIMIGTARGLNYLHEKCRDCIIHCDIKPDNILLDDDFTAKVADFGLAKLLGRQFSHVMTTIRGTRGYLAPEWILNETITEKVDVYSYGKLLFEIISGRRNMELLDDGNYFPALVAEKLSEGEEVLIQFLDKRLEGEAHLNELARACKVACWCIQDDEKNRPSMGLVIQILEGLSEVGIPPVPQLLLGFTKQDTSLPIIYEDSTFSTTSSIN